MIMKSFVISYSLYLYQRIFDELQSAPFLSPSVCIFTYLSKFRPLFTPNVKRNCASIPLLGRCGFEMSCKTCFSVNFFNLSLRSTRLSTCMRCLYRLIYFPFVGKTSHLVSRAFLLHVYLEILIKLFNLCTNAVD